MKTKLMLICITAFLAACNPAEKKDEKAHAMEHGAAKPAENVMMQAMNDAMKGMHQAKQVGNPDYDFVSMMIPHHKGAIVMADSLLKESKSIALREFAKGVITAQEKEIKTFESWLKTANQKPSANATAYQKAIDLSMVPMMEGMAQAKLSGSIDKDFIILMIPHHQSAVDMAKAYLPYANDKGIATIAQEIIAAQEAEIKWLKSQL